MCGPVSRGSSACHCPNRRPERGAPDTGSQTRPGASWQALPHPKCPTIPRLLPSYNWLLAGNGKHLASHGLAHGLAAAIFRAHVAHEHPVQPRSCVHVFLLQGPNCAANFVVPHIWLQFTLGFTSDGANGRLGSRSTMKTLLWAGRSSPSMMPSRI